MSMIPNNTLVVVADGRSARIFRNAGNESGLKLVQDESLDETNAAESSPAGMQPKDNDRDESAFAHMLANKINKAALNHSFEHIVLAADPITLGEMRKQLHKEVASRMLAEVSKDWTNTPVDKIEHGLNDLKIA